MIIQGKIKGSNDKVGAIVVDGCFDEFIQASPDSDVWVDTLDENDQWENSLTSMKKGDIEWTGIDPNSVEASTIY